MFGPHIISSRHNLAAFLSSIGAVPSLPVGDTDAQSAAASRLVKGPQFPTRFLFDAETGEITGIDFAGLSADAKAAAEAKATTPPAWEFGTGSQAPGAYTVLSYRQWDDTWKLRPQIDPRRITPPTPEAGPRLTETISRNGRRAIDDSARYLASIGKGYRTMLTLTLDMAARQRVAVQKIEGDYSDLKSREEVMQAATIPARIIDTMSQLLDTDAGTARVQTLAPVTTMQAEASRFFDAANKIYGRGMDYIEGRDYTLADGARWTINSYGEVPAPEENKADFSAEAKPLRCRLPGHPVGVAEVCTVSVFENDKGRLVFERKGNAAIPRTVRAAAEAGAAFTLVKYQLEPLRYCWAAENPKNDKGQDNPHIHVNIDWDVPLGAFRDWAARLESIWGQGFANLQRLRDPAAAGAYLLKAAKYLSKGAEEGQGWIIGNRYFVSSTARAPKFQSVAVLPYGQLPLLMEHAAEHQRETLAPLRRARDAAREAIKQATEQKNKKGRAILTGKLKELASKIDGRQIVAGKWQMLMKGTAALWRFFAWAGEQADTQGQGRELPSKPAGFGWHHNLDNGADRWHTTPTADVDERRRYAVAAGEGKARRLEWRALLKMPLMTADYMDSLMDWANRWEPIECCA